MATIMKKTYHKGEFFLGLALIGLAILAGCGKSGELQQIVETAQEAAHEDRTSFIPSEYSVPAELVTERFSLRMLTVDDVVKDYDAVMNSRARLRGVFGPSTTWPADTLSLKQNLIDLGWHQKEFQRRTSFAYTVVSLDERQVLGCVYICPTRKREFDAVVFLWVRNSEYDKGLDPILFDTVKDWIAAEWPFSKVAYPGRDIPWDRWNSLK